MTYKNHPAWDSAGQMALVAAIEREYGRSLSPAEIYRLRSYSDAIALLTQRRVTAAQAGLAICSEPSRAERVPRDAECAELF